MDTDLPGTMLADRSVIRVAGEDVRGFLQGLVTADTALLTPDAPAWAALLSPQGKVLFDFILWADGTDVLIDVEAAQAEALTKRLSLYRLRRAITLVPDDLAVHWAVKGDRGVPDPRLAELGRRWLGPQAEPAIGWHAHRLSLGVTEGVGELGAGETLWLECNARELNGVSFTKGCYVGQENTARMHHRAKVNRRLVVAPFTEPSGRTRVTYPELGLMVEHRRIEALGDALTPPWLAAALTETPND
ncbi:CAF17-like 4Fe-4S cluster assembly/insertion protein YgfZ [Sphingomonas faeni]|uniref:CAF17-like 4Fe-4S cluster assembly/insertion protein YgfZ n=1 Tax=Sphingomonas faeni TaxID=185950 RepID=UPI00278763AB|nr:folate-binding protein [Sphingomonas faeni]MDQ0839554.1 folate-binding protein YgfZ [Sphingomonas faeni]